jgi:hypothetical protein
MSVPTDHGRVPVAADWRGGWARRRCQEQQDRLLEAPLSRSRSECGRLRREPVDLAAIGAEVLRISTHSP